MTEPGITEGPQPDRQRQRAELAETVEELAHRLDVPARAKTAVHEKTDEAVRMARRRGPAIVAAVGAAAALLLVRGLWRRLR